MSEATSASFKHDGDDNRVKSEMGGVTTYYIGNYYEYVISSGATKKYYYDGGQRVAMRVCTGSNGSCGVNGATSTLTYLHADHLGSASVATCGNTAGCNGTPLGGVVSSMRYTPYGTTRSGTMVTDRRFTGQRYEAGLGLYDYNARFYDPALGRFLAADSIVPDPTNPQTLNRYAYTRNNPLKYTDPSGHDVGCGGLDCAVYARQKRQAKTATPTPTSTPRRQPTPVPAYNRKNAVDYARKWRLGNNPEYPAMSNGSDCTNFVSQCLVAGGLKPDTRWYYKGESSSNAWRYTRTDPSNVGSDCLYGKCDGLYNYLTDAAGRGFAAAEYSSQEFSADDPTQPGDVVFYLQDSPDTPDVYDPMWTHAAVVVGWGPKNSDDLSTFLTTNGGEFVSYNQGGELTLWIAEHSGSVEGLRPIYRTNYAVIQLDVVHIGVH